MIPGGFGNRGISGKIEAIRHARENQIPFLGICLGMQLLSISSTENGFTNGLSLIKNKVEKFKKEDVQNNNIPHVGFNNIKIIDDKDGFFKNINKDSNFYFVHFLLLI